MSTVTVNGHSFDDTQGLASRNFLIYRCAGCGTAARISATSKTVDADITAAMTNLPACPPPLPPGLPVNPTSPDPPVGA